MCNSIALYVNEAAVFATQRCVESAYRNNIWKEIHTQYQDMRVHKGIMGVSILLSSALLI